MTTQGEWERQFHLLHAGEVVPTRSMRCGWWSQLTRDSSTSLTDLFRTDSNEEHYAALFPLTGPPEEVVPDVVIEMPSTIASVRQGSVVVVHGWPEPGGACAVQVDGQLLIALRPGSIPFIRPTLGVLMATTSPISRWQRLRRFR